MQRESIRRELANRSTLGKSSADDRSPPLRVYEERQEQGYWKLWRLIRPAGAGLVPPQMLDASIREHVTLALTIVADFDAAREDPGEFAECLYRPASTLPYSPAVIRRCCEFLIGVADNPNPSWEDDRDLLTKERDTLGLALFSLDYFLDLPAADIPREPRENMEFAKKSHAVVSSLPAKPMPGDPVARSRSLATDYVDQVIGVSDDDEWMVLTASGASMQIVRDASTGQWTEVKAIVPARASWLDRTPPSGVPSLNGI
jgi:hypothetical protein